jgi:ribonuclease III
MVSLAPADGRAADADVAVLLAKLQVHVSDEFLDRALMHRSFAYENGGLPTNERLEFLGDSVLGLIVTDTLFRKHPELPEGNLAKLRAAVVNSRALAGVARGVRLGSYIRLGKGEESTGGRDKSSILADTLEAVIGAVYLDGGMEAADPLVHRLFDPVIARSARLGAGLDWKTSLQELTAAEDLGGPEYLVDESGPDHQKSFRAVAKVGGQVWGEGEGRTKKEAEQQAAEAAWTSISARASAAVGEGDPGQDGPARDAPGQDEPARDAPGQGGPGQDGSGRNGLRQAGAGEGDPGEGDPGQGDAGQGDPGHGDPRHGDPGHGGLRRGSSRVGGSPQARRQRRA